MVIIFAVNIAAPLKNILNGKSFSYLSQKVGRPTISLQNNLSL